MERERSPRHAAGIRPLPAAELANPPPRRARYMRPEPGRWFRPRPRLHRLLSLGVLARLTLVTAPAGYGKTSLVSDWVTHFAPQSVWISLDVRSNTLQTFVSDLIEAIGRISPTGAKAAQTMASHSQYPNPEHVARVLADDLAGLEDHLVVVLDDFHEIDDQATLAFLDTLLQSNCPHLHVVLCSRQQPALSIDALGTHGQFLEIDTATLAFNREEVADYLTLVLEGPPSDEMVDAWWTNSEGWIALMQLAAINQVTAGSGEPVAAMMAKARTSIAAFLSASLIEQLPANLHTFMLIASIPNVISPDLAQALAIDQLGAVNAVAMLDDITQRGLFLSRLDRDGTWYRFHPLFRDMLLSELVEMFGQGQVNVMHLAAADWFARNHRIERSIEHLLAAGDLNGAVDLVVSQAQQALTTDRWLELDGWLRQIPATMADQHAELLVARASVAHIMGMYNDIPPLLELATVAVQRKAGATRASEEVLLAGIDFLRLFTIHSGTRDDTQHAEAIDRIFSFLAGTNRYIELVAAPMYAIAIGQLDPDRAHLVIDRYMDAALNGTSEFDLYRRMWARSAQIILSRHSGSAERYHDLAASLLSMAKSVGSRRMMTQAHFYMGAADWERNYVERAIDHFRAVVSDPAAGPLYHILSACNLADALDLVGRIDESQTVIEELRERGGSMGSQMIATKLRQLATEMAIRHGDAPGGISMLQQALLTDTNAFVRIAEAYPIGLTVPLIQSGTPESIGRAKDILSAVQTRAREHHLPAPQISCEILIAWIDKLEGNHALAHTRLSQTLQWASDLGRVRTIIGLGPFVLPLLEWHAAAGYGTDYCDFLIESLEYEHGLLPVPAETGPGVAGLQPQFRSDELEELTNREIDVLLGLQRRLSNKEIGDELNISHLTVKSHARSIYFKLGVSGRRQAIQRAHELGLLHNRF